MWSESWRRLSLALIIGLITGYVLVFGVPWLPREANQTLLVLDTEQTTNQSEVHSPEIGTLQKGDGGSTQPLFGVPWMPRETKQTLPVLDTAKAISLSKQTADLSEVHSPEIGKLEKGDGESTQPLPIPPPSMQTPEVGKRNYGPEANLILRNSQLGYPWVRSLPKSGMPFFKTQNPKDCATARFIKADIGGKGMGADLYRWAAYLCVAHERKAVLWTPINNWYRDPKYTNSGRGPKHIPSGRKLIDPWIYWDQHFCGKPNSSQTAFECYFGRETHCDIPPAFERKTSHGDTFTNLKYQKLCMGERIDPAWKTTKFSAPIISFLFSQISQRMLQRIEHEAALTFGPDGPPANMITLHIRWGDKGKEMTLPPVSVYIKHVKEIASRCGLSQKLDVFLMSEDPNAFAAFKAEAPHEWTTRYYAPAIDTSLGSKKNTYSNPTYYSHATRGAVGLHSLIALHLALQSRHFIFTARSNWGRLLRDLALARTSGEKNTCELLIDVCNRSFGNRSFNCRRQR